MADVSQKRKILTVSAWVTLFYIAFILLENLKLFSSEGAVIGFAEPIVEWGSALVLLAMIRGRASQQSCVRLSLLPLFFVLIGIGDFTYSLFYYVLNLSPRQPFVILLTTNVYALSYLTGALAMVVNSEAGFRGWFRDLRNFIPYLFTLPLALRLLLVPFNESLRGKGFDYFVLSEIGGVVCSLFLLSTAMRVLINSRDLFWSLFSTGVVALVLPDWALRVEKLIDGAPKFGFYEYLYLLGVSILAVSISSLKVSELRLIPKSGQNSLASSYKFFSLVVVFLSLFFLCLSQYGSRDAIRIASIGCIVGCITTICVSELLISHVQRFSTAVLSIASKVREGEARDLEQYPTALPIELFETFRATVEHQLQTERERLALAERVASDQARVSLARQVSHDIRSPLAALQMIERDVSELPEERRLLLRNAISRIRDIANQLLQREAVGVAGGVPSDSAHLLSALVEQLVSEKRIQYRSQTGVSIQLEQLVGSYGIFVRVDPSALKRVLSNLIDNSVEALNGEGSVRVGHEIRDDSVEVYVIDTGPGMAAEVISKLGVEPISMGKELGHGLGLFSSRKLVESWGGSLKAESRAGKGTTLRIRIPRALPPAWFVSKLRLAPETLVAIVDDEPSVHQAWRSRIDETGVQVQQFGKPEEIEDWWSDLSPSDRSRTLLLVDYEFTGSPRTGLDLIQALSAENQSVLVTSYFEDSRIIDACLRSKIRLLPKSLVGLVPI